MNTIKQITATALALLLFVAGPLNGAKKKARIPVKVAVITMYEMGDVTGDQPGEYQFWVEREKLDKIYPFSLGPHDLRMNEQGVMGICTGPGVTNAAMVMTALGLDKRFDLRKTYFIVSGIAGGDPQDVSIGSAAWSRWVVDGDLTRSIDSREAPGDWPYGIFPSDGKKPNDRSGGWTYPGMSFKLNPSLVEWAYHLTKDVELTDHPEVAEFRKLYKGFPNASGPPKVVLGESLGSNAYWHGTVLNQWANDWVKLYTEGKGNFMMTNVEDNGILHALHRFAKIGKVDLNRVLVLRTASNYSHQPPGKKPDWSLTAPYPAEGLTALESCYRVASPVVHALVKDWKTYQDTPPGSSN